MNFADMFQFNSIPQTTLDNWEKLKRQLNIGATGQGLLPDLESAGRDAIGRAEWNMGRAYDRLQNYLDPSYSPPPSTPQSRQQIEDEMMAFGSGLMPGGMAGTIKRLNFKKMDFDPRFDSSNRVNEMDRLKNLRTVIDDSEYTPEKIDLSQYEGHPIITSMSDRTNLGQLKSINGVKVGTDMQGGQEYMFHNPGQVWASGEGPVNAIMELARYLKEQTGKDPLYAPWRMAPTGGDFANMTGETMLRYLRNNVGKDDREAVNKSIREMIPGFGSIGSEQGIEKFRNAPDAVRKKIKSNLDRDFRDAGGLTLGEARLAVADPNQLNAPEGGLQNVGMIFANNPIIQESGHRAYPRGVPGTGLGQIDKDLSVYEILENHLKARGIQDPKNPSQQDLRSLQMKPHSGILTSELLKKLGY